MLRVSDAAGHATVPDCLICSDTKLNINRVQPMHAEREREFAAAVQGMLYH